MSRYAMAMLLVLLAPQVGAEDRFEKTLSVESGGTLFVDLDAGTVEIEGDGDDEVEVEAYSAGWGSRSMRFSLRRDGADAHLEGELGGFSLGFPRVRVEVRIPKVYSVEIRTGGGSIELKEIGGYVRARTSGGSIELDEADGPAELQTSGGVIHVEELRGDLLARTSGGWIRVSDVAGEVEVRTSGGPIRIDDVAGPVRAHTSGGPISARFNSAPEGYLETSGGSIEVEFPEGAGFDLDAKTSGGRVRLEQEIDIRGDISRGHVVGEVNGGGGELTLRTSGGNILVEAR